MGVSICARVTQFRRCERGREREREKLESAQVPVDPGPITDGEARATRSALRTDPPNCQGQSRCARGPSQVSRVVFLSRSQRARLPLSFGFPRRFRSPLFSPLTPLERPSRAAGRRLRAASLRYFRYGIKCSFGRRRSEPGVCSLFQGKMGMVVRNVG